MLGKAHSLAFVATGLMSMVHMASASQVIPCALGSGSENGCSYCEQDKAIAVTPWMAATSSPNFDMPKAAAQTGGGYNVWWNIAQPDPGCRVIITEPYNTDRGSINGQLSGNVILSASHGGCYFAHVGSRGVSAAFCCGSGDCSKAGAMPAARKKRELPSSRITRGLLSSEAEGGASSPVEARGCWGGTCPQAPPPPPPPGVTCSAPTKNGDTYTKAGPQQVDGNTLSCNGGESCSLSPSISISASTSLMNEESTTHSTSDGVSVSMTAGFMFIGPTATVTAGYNHDWSESIMKAMSTTDTNTVTKTVALSIGLTPGADFNLWFTPTLRCQSYKITCDGVDQKIEKCEPVLDGNGNPTGDHGVMTVA